MHRLRTLLILLAILPPLGGAAWVMFSAWRANQAALHYPYIDPASFVEGRDYIMFDPPDEASETESPLSSTDNRP